MEADGATLLYCLRTGAHALRTLTSNLFCNDRWGARVSGLVLGFGIVFPLSGCELWLLIGYARMHHLP